MLAYNPLSLFPLPPQVADPKPVPVALAVDGYSDMLWVGSSGGLVSAFASPLTLTRNVQFPAHGAGLGGQREFTPLPGLHAGVRQIRVTDREVWTLADGGMSGRKRGGAPRWSVTCVCARAGSPTHSCADPGQRPRALAPYHDAQPDQLARGPRGRHGADDARQQLARRDCAQSESSRGWPARLRV